MLQGEHSAIRSTFIKLPFVIKIFVLSILSGRFTQVLLYVIGNIHSTSPPHNKLECVRFYLTGISAQPISSNNKTKRCYIGPDGQTV